MSGQRCRLGCNTFHHATITNIDIGKVLNKLEIRLIKLGC